MMQRRNCWLQAPAAIGGRVQKNSFATSLMRDTGMRNERELFQMRIENLDWGNRLIFVPDRLQKDAVFSDESTSVRDSPQTLWNEERWLGFSFKAFGVRTFQVDL